MEMLDERSSLEMARASQTCLLLMLDMGNYSLLATEVPHEGGGMLAVGISFYTTWLWPLEIRAAALVFTGPHKARHINVLP